MTDNKKPEPQVYIPASGEALKASASTLIDKDIGSDKIVNNNERPISAPRGFYDPMVFLGPKKVLEKFNLQNKYDYSSFELNIRTQKDEISDIL